MAEITIDNVRKNYGSLEVLHGVSVKAEDGEFVVSSRPLVLWWALPPSNPAESR